MSSENDPIPAAQNGELPAFPSWEQVDEDGNGLVEVAGTTDPGLSKREWIATHALVGYLAFNPGGEPVAQSDADVAARKAVEFADALLAELAKPKPETPKPTPEPEPTADEIAADLTDRAGREPDTDLF